MMWSSLANYSFALFSCLVLAPASAPLILLSEGRAHPPEKNLIYNREHTVMAAHWEQHWTNVGYKHFSELHQALKEQHSHCKLEKHLISSLEMT